MDPTVDVSNSDNFELSPEVLDQWENELDQFAAEVMQRISLLSLMAEIPETTDSKSKNETD